MLNTSIAVPTSVSAQKNKTLYLPLASYPTLVHRPLCRNTPQCLTSPRTLPLSPLLNLISLYPPWMIQLFSQRPTNMMTEMRPVTFSLPQVRHQKYWTRQFVGEAVKARHDPFSPFDHAEYEFLNLACDQCRKSKCKCERSSANEPCKACIMLGTRKFYIIQFVAIFCTPYFSTVLYQERNMRLVLYGRVEIDIITLYNFVCLELRAD